MMGLTIAGFDHSSYLLLCHHLRTPAHYLYHLVDRSRLLRTTS